MLGSHRRDYGLLHSEGLFRRNAWKLLLIAISCTALAALIICTVLAGLTVPSHVPNSPFHVHNRLSISIGTGALLQIICQNTLFPDVCQQDLSSYQIPLTASPLDVVSFTMQAAVSHVDDAYSLASKCSTEPGLQPIETQCASDCVELMDNTKDQLNAVVSTLSSNLGALDLTSLGAALKNAKVQLSSSLSYQTACWDGFEGAPGSIQTEIQNSQDFLTEVIANGLSLIDILSEVGNDVSSWTSRLPPSPAIPHLRRLLSIVDSVDDDPVEDSSVSIDVNEDGFPDWVSAADRKLLQAPTSSVSADAVVAQDGSGDYVTIKEALDNVPSTYQGRYVIYIKEGVYAEVFNVTKNLQNITFLGDGIGYTIITGDRNVASGQYTTYRSSTVGIAGSGFLARDVTFRNTAGASGHQAVALRAAADFLVFASCSFEGYQDTLYALSSRQFYRDCQISGTVDFIFGNAIAVFQNCKLIARQPLNQQQNTYTAQGRKLAADISGFSFQNCTLTGDASLQNSNFSVSTYLGRPWKAYSRVVFLQSDMEALVDPAGWLPWNSSNPFTDTLYYGEYQNRGPGSNTANRVLWAGVHTNMTANDASEFTVENFIGGEEWLGSLQVTYQTGLTS